MVAVSTNALRQEYPELIVSYNPLRCDYMGVSSVRFLAGGTYPQGYLDLKVHPAITDAARALASVMYAWDYAFQESAGGTLNCRMITGGTRTSLHAHGVALDFNPSRNGYKRVVGLLDDPDTGHKEGLLQWGRYTDMPAGMIRAIRKIRTVSGARLLQWGGYWYNIKDPMHFQPYCSRADVESGIDWSTVEGWEDYQGWIGLDEGDTMAFLPMKELDGIGNREFKKSDVAALQEMINEAYNAGLTKDGQYGPATKAAVKKFVIKDRDGDGGFFYGNLWTDLLIALIDVRVRKAPAPKVKLEVDKVDVVKGIRLV